MFVKIGDFPEDATGERETVIRIDPYDTWSMDHTLALVIAPMLKQLKATKQGSPLVNDEDLPEDMRLGRRDSGQKDDAYYHQLHANWEWAMDEMIWAFETIAEDDETSHWFDPYEEHEVVEDAIDRIIVSGAERRAIGKFNKDKYEAHMSRLRRGTTLFGRYYQSLWD